MTDLKSTSTPINSDQTRSAQPTKKSRMLGALALATLGLTLAACNKGGEGTGSTLVIQESADIPTLDPGTTYDTGSGQVVENL